MSKISFDSPIGGISAPGVDSAATSERHPGAAKAPILWALLALAYLFEIGAIAVVINTEGTIQFWAAVAAMAFPPITMVVVVAIRHFGEDLLYTSPGHIRALVQANALNIAPEEAHTQSGDEQ